jgi:hypothetical protein
MAQKFWINTIAKEHVLRGAAGGFTQANHGKATILKRLHAGDWIVFYSSKTSYPDGEPYQKFTALGQVADEDLYQAEMAPDFHPWRRNVRFVSVNEATIQPLIPELSFITNKTHWGFMFRFGLFEIPKADFAAIVAAMNFDVAQL